MRKYGNRRRRGGKNIDRERKGEGRGCERTKTERWKTKDGRMKSVNQIRVDVKKEQGNKRRKGKKPQTKIKFNSETKFNIFKRILCKNSVA